MINLDELTLTEDVLIDQKSPMEINSLQITRGKKLIAKFSIKIDPKNLAENNPVTDNTSPFFGSQVIALERGE